MLKDRDIRYGPLASGAAALPWVFTLIFFVYLGLRVLVVARLDWDTALAVLSSAGPVSIGLALVMASSSTILHLAGVLSVVLAARPNARPVVRQSGWLLYLLVWILALLFMSTLDLLILTVFGVSVAMLSYPASEGFGDKGARLRWLLTGNPYTPWDEYSAGFISDLDSVNLRVTGLIDRTAEVEASSGALRDLLEDDDFLEDGALLANELASVEDDVATLARESAATEADVERLGQLFRAAQFRRPAFTHLYTPLLVLLVWIYLVGVIVRGLFAPPWLPAERIVLDGRSPVVGYVLDTGPQWTSVLTEQERIVVRVLSEEIQRREVCSLGNAPAAQNSLLGRLWSEQSTSRVPPCEG